MAEAAPPHYELDIANENFTIQIILKKAHYGMKELTNKRSWRSLVTVAQIPMAETVSARLEEAMRM